MKVDMTPDERTVAVRTGAMLRARRRQLDVPIRQIKQEAHLSKNQITQLEAGRVLRFPVFIRMLLCLGLEPEEISEGLERLICLGMNQVQLTNIANRFLKKRGRQT